MARATEVELKFIADIGDLQKRLAEVPDIGADSAKKLVKELTSQYKKAKSASDQLARDLKDSGDKMGKGLEGVKNVAEGLGGSIGATAGQVEKMVQAGARLSAAVGPLPAALGAAAVGVGILTAATVGASKALFGFIGDADDAIDRLEDISGVDPLSPRTIQALDDWRQGALNAEAAGARLHAILAGELAKAFEDLPNTLARVATVAGDVALAIGRVREDFEVFAPVLRASAALLTLGTSELLRWALASDEVTNATDRQDEAIKRLNEAMELSNKLAGDLRDSALIAMTNATAAEIAHFKALEAVDEKANKAIETRRKAVGADAEYEAQVLAAAEALKQHEVAEFRATKAKQAGAEASRIAAEAARKEAQDAAEVNDFLRSEAKLKQDLAKQDEDRAHARAALGGIVADYAAAEMSDADKTNAKYDEQIAKIKELGKTAQDVALVKEAIDAAELARQDELVKAQQSQLDSAVSVMEQLRNKAQEIYDQQRANFGETLAQVAQYTDVFSSAFANWAQLFEQLHEDELERITTQADARKSSFEAWKQSEKERINMLLQTGKISEAEHAELMAQYHEDRKTRKANLDGKLDDLSGAAAKEFKGMRKAQRARIIAEGAAAIVAMTAQMATFLGPAAPVAAAAVMTPVIAAQLDQVNKQTPPEFPMGGLVSERMGLSPERGSPDHVLVGVRPDELILSPAESARAMTPTHIVLQLDRRTIAEAIADVGGVGYLSVPSGRISGRATIYGRG